MDLDVGGSIQIGGHTIPENATDKGVWFRSSDEEVLTINSSGIVNAIANGTATITVFTSDGNFTDTIESVVGTGIKADS